MDTVKTTKFIVRWGLRVLAAVGLGYIIGLAIYFTWPLSGAFLASVAVYIGGYVVGRLYWWSTTE